MAFEKTHSTTETEMASAPLGEQSRAVESVSGVNHLYSIVHSLPSLLFFYLPLPAITRVVGAFCGH